MTAAPVVVTGMGLVSPAGIGVANTWDALCAGVSAGARDEEFAGLPVDISCAVPGFDAAELLGLRLSWRIDPFVQMALVAAREAVADAGLSDAGWEPERVAVILGVATASMVHWHEQTRHVESGDLAKFSPMSISRSVPNMAAGEINMDLAVTGPSFTVSSACASGATAIGLARDMLAAGACDIAIAGGAESGRARLANVGFHRMRALSSRCADPATASRPFDVDRDGFVLGEGAGIVVLERAQDARARGARVRGTVLGYGASADAYHFTAPHPEGRGAELAVRTALRDAGLEPSDIGHVNAHATSTPAGDTAEALMLTRVFPDAPPVTAPKSLTGHTLGAGGAIEACFTLLALEHKLVPPIANLARADESALALDLVTDKPREVDVPTALSNSFGFGGQNASLVLGAA